MTWIAYGLSMGNHRAFDRRLFRSSRSGSRCSMPRRPPRAAALPSATSAARTQSSRCHLPRALISGSLLLRSHSSRNTRWTSKAGYRKGLCACVSSSVAEFNRARLTYSFSHDAGSPFLTPLRSQSSDNVKGWTPRRPGRPAPNRQPKGREYW